MLEMDSSCTKKGSLRHVAGGSFHNRAYDKCAGVVGEVEKLSPSCMAHIRYFTDGSTFKQVSSVYGQGNFVLDGDPAGHIGIRSAS